MSVWFEQAKLEWILGEGHGGEWTRVFHVGPRDWERVWAAIADKAFGAIISEVRDRRPHGVTCGIEVSPTIDERSAPTIVAWHFAVEIAAPRLVTAYPTP